MILSIKDKKELGLYLDEGCFAGSAYANTFISSFLWFLYLRNLDTPTFCEVIELCGRNFEMSRFCPDIFEGFGSVSIDLKAQNRLNFCTDIYYENPYDDDSSVYGYNHDGQSHTKDEFDAIAEDVFSYSLSSAIRMYSDDKRDDFFLAIYCRPPMQKPMNKFPGSFDDATRSIEQFVQKRSESLGVSVTCPCPLSIPEWYFTLKAASLLASGTPSKAVIQIPVRLLNLARATDGRKLLVELGLVESVLILPRTSQNATVDTALITLSKGEPGRGILFYDCRPFNGQPISNSKVDLIIDTINGVWNNPDITNDKKHYFAPETKDGICSLLPTESSVYFSQNCYVKLLSLCSIRRGMPRSSILKLEESIKHPEQTKLYYYVSSATLPDGANIKATAITCRRNTDTLPLSGLPEDPYIADSDIYDLSHVAQNTLNALKPLDVSKANLLISRTGAPFRITLISNAFVILNGTDKDFTALISDGEIIPSDNTIVATFEDEETALFLLAFFQSNEGQQALLEIAHGNKLTQLSTRDLRNLKVPFPSKKERQEIVERYQRKQEIYLELQHDLKCQGELVRNIQAE